MVARVVAREDLESAAGEVAAQLAAGAPLAQRFIKSGLDVSSRMSFEETLTFEATAQGILLDSEDLVEGATAFLEKRSPRFKGR